MDEEEEEGMAVMCPSSYSPARNTNATHTIPRRDQFFFRFLHHRRRRLCGKLVHATASQCYTYVYQRAAGGRVQCAKGISNRKYFIFLRSIATQHAAFGRGARAF